ncbi:MAG: hypothetical protein DIZ80_12640 [endosymbiont of Galathealinum brachiosum]|uniref:BIG2 domain-containing protein n=1 Tax=endosymbiont of Galathealinum brachiosum TaxID=2200906 RepID=A0A370DDW9_9GAMM|nr:MAG: hypothetical protein DIZ80_12640 [endosymbiont of Galathealinum brachiosum]
MFFRKLFVLVISILFIFINACSDSEKENNLVDLHTLANQDIISISFPIELNESILSINSEFYFVLQGVKSNNIDTTIINNDVIWSLSDNAISTIDQTGYFSAGNSAELITLTAKFGPLVETFEIKVSDAKFDEVVQLNEQDLSINMCQSKNIKPVARYIDSNGINEIRLVDSNIINTIVWLIRNQEDNSTSQRAHISTENNQANLHTLAAGNIIIQAQALSVFSNTEKTSADFNQNVSNTLNSIKICNNDNTDLDTCNVTSANVEKDKSISLITIGNYQAEDGSNFNQNISQNSKWGIDNATNASVTFSSDFQRVDVNGLTESTSAVLTTACGTISQSLSSIDITQGVVLSSQVSCDAGIDCLDASSSITIDKLGVSSFTVTANDIDLTDNTSETLSSRPDEITLKVIANFTNSTSRLITTDDELVYSITAGDGDVIEEITGSSGVFTVLRNGTANIKLDYRTETFTVFLVIP